MTTAAVATAAPQTATHVKAHTTPLKLEKDIVTTPGARIALAVTRYATGFVFLWAFLDKTFGLGYSTAPANAWINGGAPAQGYLMHAVGESPVQGFFQSLASPLVDVLFMLGLLGIGLAVILGMGLRLAAVAGTAMMLLMYIADWPFAAGSTNPIVDYHIIYALVLIVIAATAAGDTWGLGAQWKKLPFVQKNRWLV